MFLLYQVHKHYRHTVCSNISHAVKIFTFTTTASESTVKYKSTVNEQFWSEFISGMNINNEIQNTIT